MKSCLYFGEVRHHRKSPKHDLKYKLFMPHLFLDEIKETLNKHLLWSYDRSNLYCFKRSDYHKPKVESLEEAVRSTMTEQIGQPVLGPIAVLTHLRTFGYCFNPVTFYYAWDADRVQPTVLMAEITNTPWHERYAKALPWTDSENSNSQITRHKFRKEFHVSPFIDMAVDYDWKFHRPEKKVKVDMILRKADEVFFSAHLNLHRKPITSFNLAWSLLRFPFLTLRISSGIYLNALILRLKGCSFYAHPKHAQSVTDDE